jgi:hypothetical protein
MFSAPLLTMAKPHIFNEGQGSDGTLLPFDPQARGGT